MVDVIVSGNGTYYKDGVERLYLHFRKADNHGLPADDGAKTPITLIARGHKYAGVMNARDSLDYLFVSPDMTDEVGGQHKLTYLLLEWGLVKAGRVQASVAGTRITLAV